jgi:hypothetical protein
MEGNSPSLGAGSVFAAGRTSENLGQIGVASGYELRIDGSNDMTADSYLQHHGDLTIRDQT